MRAPQGGPQKNAQGERPNGLASRLRRHIRIAGLAELRGMRECPVPVTDRGMAFDTFFFKRRVLAVRGAIGPYPAGPAPAGAVGGEFFAVLEHEFGIQQLAGNHGRGPVFFIGLGPGHLGDDGAVRPGRCLAAAGPALTAMSLPRMTRMLSRSRRWEMEMTAQFSKPSGISRPLGAGAGFCSSARVGAAHRLKTHRADNRGANFISNLRKCGMHALCWPILHAA